MLTRLLVVTLMFPGGLLLASAPETPSSASTDEGEPAAMALVAPLTAEELRAAVRMDRLTIPSPGELMIALGKAAKPNWQGEYRKPIPTSFGSRVQIALNIGGLIADGYIAVQAEDSQQVKNTGRDITALAKGLGVSEGIISRGNSIFEFAENNEWATLKEELEATQNEVKLALEAQNDRQLVWLVTLGGWLRGTEVVSSWIASNYSPEAAKLLRQPAIIELIWGNVSASADSARNVNVVDRDPTLKEIAPKLVELQARVTFPEGHTPTEAEVRAIHALTRELVELISTK